MHAVHSDEQLPADLWADKPIRTVTRVIRASGGQMRSTIVILCAALCLSGCVSTLSDDRIREETGAAIGVPASQITITNIRHEMTNTFYDAATPSGAQYACTLNGGNVMTLGMTNPAICNRKGR